MLPAACATWKPTAAAYPGRAQSSAVERPRTARASSSCACSSAWAAGWSCEDRSGTGPRSQTSRSVAIRMRCDSSGVREERARAHEHDVVGDGGRRAALPRQQRQLAAVIAPVQHHVREDVLDTIAELAARAVAVGDLAIERGG